MCGAKLGVPHFVSALVPWITFPIRRQNSRKPQEEPRLGSYAVVHKSVPSVVCNFLKDVFVWFVILWWNVLCVLRWFLPFCLRIVLLQAGVSSKCVRDNAQNTKA